MTNTPGNYPASPGGLPPAPGKLSAWQRVKRWPLILKIPAIGCGGLLALFAAVVALGIVISIVDPDGTAERAAEREQERAEVETATKTTASAEPSDEPEESESPSPSPSDSESPSEEPSEEPSEDPTTESPTPSPSPTTQSPSPTPTQDADTHTAVVTRVIDGDTVVLDNDERVRLLGIDAPETAECHADTATQRMIELVQGETVTLVRDGDDRDHYERLLRYVDVDGVDAGLTLIQEGLAISRYDSRDGYGFHTREPDYIAADDATPMRTCQTQAPEPEPEPAAEQPGTECAEGYSPCIPPYPPDINCGDLPAESKPVRVTGSDPHGLDRDKDGWGCESG